LEINRICGKLESYKCSLPALCIGRRICGYKQFGFVQVSLLNDTKIQTDIGLNTARKLLELFARNTYFLGLGHFDVNDKNCSLSIVLTATDQKLQKS